MQIRLDLDQFVKVLVQARLYSLIVLTNINRDFLEWKTSNSDTCCYSNKVTSLSDLNRTELLDCKQVHAFELRTIQSSPLV